MAFVVMAYIVTTYTVMVYVVMAWSKCVLAWAQRLVLCAVRMPAQVPVAATCLCAAWSVHVSVQRAVLMSVYISMPMPADIMFFTRLCIYLCTCPYAHMCKYLCTRL